MPEENHTTTQSMSWSWKLIQLAGVDVYVHATFFILLAWVGLSYWQTDGSFTAAVAGVGFVLAIFACVVLHELGHSLAARRYGIRTRNITLLPIGGVAALEKMPDKPMEEIVVAIAGPAVNVLIAAILFVWLVIDGLAIATPEFDLVEGPFLVRLLAVNVILVVFNMLPALPMDGGRVFRAALALRMDHISATKKAVQLGQSLAFALGFIGLLYNPFLVIIAVFVWIGAAAELRASEVKSALSGVGIEQVMLTDFARLAKNDSLGRAIELTLHGCQKDFPVVSGDEVVGVLTHKDLLRGLQDEGETARVRDWMQRDTHSADVSTKLSTVFDEMAAGQYLLSVTRGGQLLGIVDLENILEFLRIQAAVR